jgi:asparagine synthase (glutamine-hydrolysing)
LIADAPVKAARRRDVPVPHRFEHWLRSMAVGAREENSRTILNGHGGDNHFGLSSIYLAELLRRGRWRHLWRDWILRRGRSPRGALEKLVYPLLPRVITHVARLLRRGRPLSGTLDRDLPPWFDQRFARRHRLLEREYDGAPHLGSQDVAREEVYWLLADGQHPALNALMYGIGLDEGTALRTPMFDARVVRFAASRPMEERAAGLETKLLLRRSVRGLLPDSILEPRSSRTGSMTTFYKEGLMWRIPELRRIATGDSRLISLGFVDRVALHRTIEEFASEPASGDGGMLNVVLEVESWLLAR